MSEQQAVETFLRDHGLLAEQEHAAMTPLGGGVSSDLWKVDLRRGSSICVKRALPRLKVARPWFAPVSRNHVECLWLAFAEPIRPGQVPRVLADDEEAGLFAMEYLPPARYPVWKEQLLGGQISKPTAGAVGDLVGALHAAGAADPAAPARFATDDNFEALRIEPYLRATARAHPDLAAPLQSLAETTAATHLTVVHGDVSPKNILVGPTGPVLLDAECAWFGDPAFDVAFCVNHLLIKSIKLPERAADLLQSAKVLVEAHAARISWEEPTAFGARVTRLLPALALARVDGSSPVEYLDEPRRATLRRAARALLSDPATDFDQLCERWSVLSATEGVRTS